MKICYAQNSPRPSLRKALPSILALAAALFSAANALPQLQTHAVQIPGKPGVQKAAHPGQYTRNSGLSPASTSVEIIQQKNVSCIKVKLDTFSWASRGEGIYPDAPDFLPSGVHMLPMISILVTSHHSQLPLREIRTSDPEIIVPPERVIYRRDSPIGGNTEQVVDVRQDDQKSHRVEIKKLGRFRDSNVFALRVLPILWDEEQERFSWTKDISITLSRKHETQVLSGGTGYRGKDLFQKLGKRYNADSKQPPPYERRAVPPDYSMAVEMHFECPGVYRISAKQLRAVLDRDYPIDPGSFRLYHRGQEQFLRVQHSRPAEFTGQDYIEFPVRISHTETVGRRREYNVYYLVWGGKAGKRFVPVSVDPSDRNPYYLRSYRHHLHFESDRFFDRLGGVNTGSLSREGHHWFHSGPLESGGLESFTFHVPDPDPVSLNDVSLLVHLRGLSTDIAGHHQAALYINDRFVGETEVFRDKKPYLYRRKNALPNRNMLEDENVLRLAVKEVSNEFESLVLDWFEIEYDRLFRAVNDYLEFASPPSSIRGQIYECRLSNFRSPAIRLYRDDGLYCDDIHLQPEEDGSFSARIQTVFPESQVRFFAVSDSGVRSPARMHMVYFPSYDLRDITYLIISPSLFAREIWQWAEYRREQGWNTAVISAEDIYRQFSYGYPAPGAIRRCIQSVADRSGSDRLLHVLLVGDPEPKNHSNDPNAHLPVAYYQTEKYGAAETDYFYANLDTSDLIPEAAVGRIPVKTREELRQVFEKIRGYEMREYPGPWTMRGLFIAGYNPVFKTQTEELIREKVPDNYFPERLYIDLKSGNGRFYGETEELLSYLNAGVGYVNFFGHGGGAVWADRSLFLREHINVLENESALPFVTSMTCFTGSLQGERGLGKQLLLKPGGGAIGVFASSGLGWLWNDYLLAYDIPGLLGSPGYTLGEILHDARIGYLGRAGRYGFQHLTSSMLYQYNLLGDPVVHLPVPQDDDEITGADKRLRRGDHLKIEADQPYPTKLQIYSAGKLPVFPEGFQEVPWIEIPEGNYTCAIPLPDELPRGQGHVAYYRETDSGRDGKAGAWHFGLETPVMEGFQTNPALPRSGDSVYFSVRIYDATVDSAWVRTSGGNRQLTLGSSSEILWRTRQPLPGVRADEEIRWRVEIRTGDGEKITGPWQRFRVRLRPDLSLRRVSVNHGEKPVLLVIAEINDSPDGMALNGNPLVKLSLINSRDSVIAGMSRRLKFGPGKKDTLKIPFYNDSGNYTLRYHIDTENLVPEENEANNIGTANFTSNIYGVTPALGLTFDGRHSHNIVDEIWHLSIPPGCVVQPTTVRLEPIILPFDSSQWQMSPLLSDGHLIRAFRVMYHPQQDDSPEVELRIDTVLTDTTFRLYRKAEASASPWEQCTAGTVGETQPVDQEGIYSPFSSRDTQPPTVSVSIGDQQYLPEMYVNLSPVFRFLTEDETGVTRCRDRLRLYVDGRRVPSDDPDLFIHSNDSRVVQVEYRANFTPGSHRLRFSAADIHGNRTEDLIHGVISRQDAELLDYGNFPNPFQYETFFHYELTARASAFTLDIFTVDGRRIVRFDPLTCGDPDPMAAGFHRFPWDGRDDDGAFIANGVYFYRMKVQIGDKTHTSIGKLAKAR